MYLVCGLMLAVVVVYGTIQFPDTHNPDKKSHSKAECCQNICGLPGRDGRDGRDGNQGPYGPPGPQGEKGPPGQSFWLESNLEVIINILSAKMSALITEEMARYRNSVEEHKTIEGRCRSDSTPKDDTAEIPDVKETAAGGAVYTRWGRKSCPSHSTTLYQGVMAGGHYQHDGEGANHLCLPLIPQWNKTFSDYQSKAYLYGTEFEIYSTNPVFHNANSGGSSLHNKDAQCAVCYTPSRSSHVMIPARLECPAGWTVEYLGFLMAAHTSHKRTEYVCVDQDPDTHPGTAPNVNAHLLYTVEAVCGPLPCPDYVNGYEVTCVVCTK